MTGALVEVETGRAKRGRKRRNGEKGSSPRNVDRGTFQQDLRDAEPTVVGAVYWLVD